MSEKSVRVLIEGLVQGVWYRAWTEEQAVKRDLDGWVRNRHDGHVEAVFSGASEMVDDMIEACRRGPDLARVQAIEITDEADEVESGFVQKPTV